MGIFGTRLRELRKENRLKQWELAEILGLSRQAISCYENGEREPTIDTLIKISLLFSVTTDYLTGNSDVRRFQHDALQLSLQNKDDPEYIVMISNLIAVLRALFLDLFQSTAYPYPDEVAYTKLFEAYIGIKEQLDKLFLKLLKRWKVGS